MEDVVEQLAEGAAECAHARVWAMSDTTLVSSIEALHSVRCQLDAAQAHLVHEMQARGLPKAQGATSAIAWLRWRLRLSPSEAKELIGLGRLLDRSLRVDAAACAGQITGRQAQAIGSAIAGLPKEVGPEVIDQATGVMLDFAARFDPTELAACGKQILAHVDPEAGKEAEQEQAEDEAEYAHDHRGLDLTDTGDGRTRITGWLDAAGAAALGAALDPLTKPLADDTRSATQRRADALVEIANLALRTTDLPDNGGEPTHLVTTMDLDDLRRQVGVGTLDTGGRLTPTQVRQMACDARILPAVLDGRGQPVDLGRGHRVINVYLRRALILRDRGCSYPGCDRRARWCQGHHIRSWVDGGPTDLGNTMLICAFHHRKLHHDGWEARIAPDGQPEFIPPPWIDPEQQSMRNYLHDHQRQPQHMHYPRRHDQEPAREADPDHQSWEPDPDHPAVVTGEGDRWRRAATGW